MSYTLETENIENLLKQENRFFDFLDDEADHTDRFKKNERNKTNHELSAQVDISSLFGKLSDLRFLFDNYLRLTNLQESQADWRMNPFTNEYDDVNASLRYDDRLQEALWRPGFTVGKTKHTRVARGSKIFGVSAHIELESLFRENISTHALRGLKLQQHHVLPSLRLFYNQNYSTATKRLELNYETKVKTPELYQQVSLLDTVEKDYNYVGNRSLIPENQYHFSVKYSYRQSLHSTNHDISLNYTLYDNQMVDSNRYDDFASLNQFTVNTKGLPSLVFIYTLQTAKKLMGRPLNLLILVRANSKNNYFFNDGTRYKNNQLGASLFSRVNYDVSEIVALNFQTSARINRNDYSTNKIQTSYRSIGTDLILKWPKRVTFINSFAYSNYKISNLDGSNQFLWNAHIYYRMLKKEQLEFKFSIYDILNNKKNIVDTANQNIIRRVSSNNLRQYLMFSISFYPRKF